MAAYTNGIGGARTHWERLKHRFTPLHVAAGGNDESGRFCPGLFGGRFRTGMAAFAAEAPLVRLTLVECAPDALRAALNRHRLDMTISPLSGMTNDAEHDSEFLWNEQLVAALPEKG
jgi:DNA-binding transcriptional LysR family regulator